MTVVITEKRKGLAFITLNRPELLNALNPEMAAALHRAVVDVSADDDTRCVVILGAGEGFMAGGDVGFFQQSLNSFSTGEKHAFAGIFDDVHGTIRAIYTMRKPVIAGVQGAVAGFGVSLMTACDLAIATEDSMFTLAYSHIGASPDGGSTFALPRMVGLKRAMELTLLGDKFDAKRAQSLGLVNWVVPIGHLRPETEKLATRLASGPTKAYATTKTLLNSSFNNDLGEQLDLEQTGFVECATSDDFSEGVHAFLEKRHPRFRGR